MELQINNQKKHYDVQLLNIPQLLEIEHSSSLKGLAVAVNEHVISRSLWDTYELKSGDNILIITATQGG